ncbi:MAG: peptide-methionine (S)-S-oxide reductase MsrA [Methanomassiliicoccus sp.]|nr:peptide-methionine (S)-S-oxide reductase MsrA [Methanomassiliicoccus sp.]
MTEEKATFGAGCFWGVQAAFDNIEGVTSTTVGYTGGTLENPTYRDVCGHRTGHAEAVEISFDPRIVKYDELLEVFWRIHDPTTLNRQGPDVGDQYRSSIFYHTPEQREKAERSKSEQQASGRYRNPIVTEIVPAGKFWRAEEYHQKYLVKHGRAACHTR